MIHDPPTARFRARLRLTVFGLLLLVVAGACNMVSLGYGNLPALLTYRVDQWFSLNDSQSALVKARLEALHAWHRREALAVLVRDLDDAQARLARPLTMADADWFVSQAQSHYRRAVSRMISDSADLLATLRPEQVAHLEKHFAKRNREFAEKYIDPNPDKIRKARLERVESTAQEWLGPLSTAQRERLRGQMASMPADYPAMLSESERRQGELASILRGVTEGGPAAHPAGAADQRAVEVLKRWALDWESGRTQSYRKQADGWIRGYKELYVELINNASTEQRNYLRERLRYYSRELTAFVQPPRAAVRLCEICGSPDLPG